MTAAPNAEVIEAVEALQAERDELRDLLRTVIASVPVHAEFSTVYLPTDLLAEIRRRT